MLSEFYCIFLFITPVIIFILSFSKIIDTRVKNENKMHKAVYSFFMDDKCENGFKCSGSELSIKDLYSISVRKPSKALKETDKGGIKDDSLTGFYKDFEDQIKASSGK